MRGEGTIPTRFSSSTVSQGREAQDASLTLGGVLIIFPYLSYSYITVST